MMRVFLAVLCVCLFLGLSFRASAQTPEIGSGIVCDTADQVREVGSLFEKQGNDAAIQAVNQKAGGPACGVLTISFVRGVNQGSITVANREYMVLEIAVIAILVEGQWQRLRAPLVRFTAVPTEERPA